MGGVCFRGEAMLSFDRMEVSSAWYSGMFFRDEKYAIIKQTQSRVWPTMVVWVVSF